MRRLSPYIQGLARHFAPFLLAACLGTTASAQPKLQVVATLTDLRSIAEEIGGDRVETFAIATGFQNPHFVDPKPSYIVRLARADLFVTVGLDLETGWVPPLLNSARNPRILPGASGYVDASANVPLLQVPSSVSREQGDIHVYGNPHYWLDPERGKIVARNIADGLKRLEPGSADYFEENLKRFTAAIDQKMLEWTVRLAPYAGTPVIAYHNEYPYLEAAFGFRIVDFLEPKPGIPPSPAQLARVIRTMKDRGIRVIIISPYFNPDAAELVAGKIAGGTVVTIASSVEAFHGIETYFDLFDYNVDQLVRAFQQTPGP